MVSPKLQSCSQALLDASRIEAPRSLKVHRAELLAQLEESNRQAASPSDDLVAQLSQALAQDRDAETD